MKVLRIILIILLSIGLTACGLQESPVVEAMNAEAAVDEQTEPAILEASIIAVGDIMFHMPQVQEARTELGYNFDIFFEKIRSYIHDADVAIGNFETTVNNNKPLSGYPRFNSPPEAVKSISNAGFDIMVTANNHCMDTGVEGADNTLALIKQNNMRPLGTGEDKQIIIEVNGIRLGVLAYATSVNGLKAPEGYVSMAEEGQIKADIEGLKGKCDFIIVYMHAGAEYKREVEAKTAKLFRTIADMGADCVLGSHPHVVRKSELYETRGKQVLINYSMGNFLSNQNDKYTDIGSMTKLVIQKQGEAVSMSAYEIIPTYRLRYRDTDGRLKRRIIPVADIDSYSQINDKDKTYIREVSEEAIKLLTEEEKEIFNLEK